MRNQDALSSISQDAEELAETYSLRLKPRSTRLPDANEPAVLSASSLTPKRKTQGAALRSKRASQQSITSANCQLFYKTLYFRLEALFISAKAAAGGFTELKPGWFHKIDSWVDIASDMFSVAPLVGPVISQLCQLALKFDPLLALNIDPPLQNK